MKKSVSIFIILLFSILSSIQTAFPHCDTMDGPVISDARKAFEKNNVNHVLKWVRASDENEIKKAFQQAMKVRVLNADARELADNYFFNVVVRVHRSGEGVPFTGVLPSGSPIDEKIKAADRSIELGNLGPLEKMVPREKYPELKKRFDAVMALKNFDVNNVAAGREYIEAYVRFFHFAEGEEGGARDHGGHAGHLLEGASVFLTVIFFISTVILGILYYKRKK